MNFKAATKYGAPYGSDLPLRMNSRGKSRSRQTWIRPFPSNHDGPSLGDDCAPNVYKSYAFLNSRQSWWYNSHRWNVEGQFRSDGQQFYFYPGRVNLPVHRFMHRGGIC